MIAQRYGATAVTIGRDIYFDPHFGGLGTPGGRRRLAHELAHAAQPAGNPPVARREVVGDPLEQSISVAWVKRLDNAELERQATMVAAKLQRRVMDSAEQEELARALTLMEDEAALRGIELTGVAAISLKIGLDMLTRDVQAQVDDIRATLAMRVNSFTGTTFGDISGPFTGWGVDRLGWVATAVASAAGLAAQAEAGGQQGAGLLQQAATRYAAALFGAQCMMVWLSYVKTAAAGVSHAVPISFEHLAWRILGVRDKLDPSMKDLASLDAAKVAAVADRFPALAASFKADFDHFVTEFDTASKNYAQFMKVFAVYQLVLGLIGGIAMGAGGAASGEASVALALPGIGGISAGGVATGIRIVISAEWLEMIRRLGMIGAISLGTTDVIVGLAYPGEQLAAPGGLHIMLRSTPQGSVTPSSGKDSGKSVSYGDTRAKHTKIADHSLQEMKDAAADPSKATGDLKGLRDNLGNPAYGSQLSKEATDKYATLVKDALENGTRFSPTRINHVAAEEIGINIMTGSGTKNYTMHFSLTYGGWHIFPN
jgi:hypothetical protein